MIKNFQAEWDAMDHNQRQFVQRMSKARRMYGSWIKQKYKGKCPPPENDIETILFIVKFAMLHDCLTLSLLEKRVTKKRVTKKRGPKMK